MDKVLKELKLTELEEQELRDGQALYELTQTSGFKVLEGWLNDMAYHSWIDPREVDSEKEYLWRELSGFHASNNARELVERIQKAISQSEYLQKKKKGEVDLGKMIIK